MRNTFISLFWERKFIAILTGFASFSLGLAYLLLKVQSVRDVAGFDFRYLWVAANVWGAGQNPYESAFLEFSQNAITEGHVPPLWPYPPTWWPLSLTLPLEDILTANFFYNLFCILILFVASLIVGAITAALMRQGEIIGHPPWHTIFAVQGLVFLVLSATESTAIHLSVGQTSAFAVLGGALLLWGQVRSIAVWRILGLVLLFLKPQLGIPFAAAYLITYPRAVTELALAAVLSIGLALPAIIADPATISGFLRNATAYQNVSIANHPAATTGIRSAVHAVLGIEIGNFIALAISCLVAVLLALRHGGRDVELWLMVPLATLAVLSLSPIHYYGFTLALLAFPLFSILRGARMWLFAFGFGLIFRADNLGTAIGFYDHDVGIFEGSWLSTIGAMLMLLATVGWRSRSGRVAAG